MKANDCNNCPHCYYWVDNWGEEFEECGCGYNIRKGCRKPMIIRHLIAFKKWLILKFGGRK